MPGREKQASSLVDFSIFCSKAIIDRSGFEQLIYPF
jgi:hypothetical protein